MAAAAAQESLSVIALVSGGKDSFYSVLHCQANGHRVVALANLYPPRTAGETNPGAEQHQTPARVGGTHGGNDGDDDGETDLNSFMYQTVGHQIIPLYARATGLPLYRQPIVGTAVHHGVSYENPRHGAKILAASNGETLRPSDDQLSPATRDLPGCAKREADEGREHGLKQELELKLDPDPEPEPEPEDETESLVPLLRAVLKAHPEANALCTGAILSTYQRTRVESVALRLGLVPLSYLWQFTELPTTVPSSRYDQDISLAERVTRSARDNKQRARKRAQKPARDDAQLLRDMAAVGLETRIVKVASAGLEEDFLWENVASEAGVQRVERAMRRFGAAGGRGSILGEGGEFETLVVDGPPSLFRGRIVVSDGDRRVIREGGGCAWLSFRRADVVLKDQLEQADELHNTVDVRIPELLDPIFEDALQCLLAFAAGDIRGPAFVNLSSCDDNTKPTVNSSSSSSSYSITARNLPRCELPLSPQSSLSQEWCYLGTDGAESLAIEQQTVSIVDQIRRRLDEHAIPATAITNSVIALRRMSDFPLVNKHYGSLFRKPNPPSRVTISCGGELLPKDAAIAIYLTVQLGLQPHERRGLHVQSRSYWAPANIGPYSQAIAFPLVSLPIPGTVSGEDGEDDYKPHQQSYVASSPLAVSIAGQIPLVPASMALPSSSTSHYVELQITLALQHLWRVGVEMQVRWWTSAVAYFPAASSTDTMQRQALLAATAWKAAHLWPDLDSEDDSDENDVSDDDDNTGPDIWDRRYNAAFVTYGGGDEEESFPLSLPNWSVLKGSDVHDDDYDDKDGAKVRLKTKLARIPFFFAAEVEELPRQAGVEWHAHLGLAELQPGCVPLFSAVGDRISSETGLLEVNLHHVFVDAGEAVFAQTTAVLRPPVDHDKSQRTLISTNVLRGVFAAVAASLRELLNLPSYPSIKPKITYTEAVQLGEDDDLKEIGALIPCRSLWDSRGCPLSAVSIFETRVAKAK
ncbi:hypothetical protein F5Y12DRAFT_69021 [Xylaria sp. FL1777]|nr:hypothetical protein F5Y12DRAFT_69021 [Xylaria sp. FL1777]